MKVPKRIKRIVAMENAISCLKLRSFAIVAVQLPVSSRLLYYREEEPEDGWRRDFVGDYGSGI